MTQKYIVEHFSNKVFCSYAKTNFLKSDAFHLHNYYEMNLFLEGDMTFFIDDTKIQPVRGTLFLIDSTQVHGPTLLSNNIYERAIVHFDPKLAVQLSSGETDLLDCYAYLDEQIGTYAILSEEEIALFSELTKKIEGLSDRPAFGGEILINAYLAQLLVMANRTAMTNRKIVNSVAYSDTVRQLIAYINDNIEKSISLEEIERSLAMNRHYLNRMFKDELGSSIYQFVTLKKSM